MKRHSQTLNEWLRRLYQDDEQLFGETFRLFRGWHVGIVRSIGSLELARTVRDDNAVSEEKKQEMVERAIEILRRIRQEMEKELDLKDLD